jgi:hypothetical protein
MGLFLKLQPLLPWLYCRGFYVKERMPHFVFMYLACIPKPKRKPKLSYEKNLNSPYRNLHEFTANYQKPDALLEWSTTDEENVEKFIIERGSNPLHFVPVGTVAAKGGSGVTHYQFKDGLASLGGGKGRRENFNYPDCADTLSRTGRKNKSSGLNSNTCTKTRYGTGRVFIYRNHSSFLHSYIAILHIC